MKILLVYPGYPDTFWSFRHALKFISRKAAFPPLGLLTVASMLPQEWEKKLVDMNTDTISARDIQWADYVFISAMTIQRRSAKEVIARCNEEGTPVVAGGPLFTSEYEKFEGVDHFVLNEAELTLPEFLADLHKGCARHIYTASGFPDISSTPIPAWELCDMGKYSSMCIQYSRGCPFDCEFCSIVAMNGHVPRTKGTEQLLAELEALYRAGWRSNVFIVDDNFIGNKKKLKESILPALGDWLSLRRHPFSFTTEASINISDDDELIRLMVKADFTSVFVGIETISEESLAECGKIQNKGRDMVAAIKKLHASGLQVLGGFILGFDNDRATVFENMISFIQEAGIVTAMVGLLNAPSDTRLYRRLAREGRIRTDMSGDNTDWTMNFTPKMDHSLLLEGYKRIITTIYSHKGYYERVRTFLSQYRPARAAGLELRPLESLSALLRSLWILGIREKGRRHYWGLLASTALKRPRLFPLSVTLAIYGYHFRKTMAGYGLSASR